MAIKFKVVNGLEQNKDVLRLVLNIWPNTDVPHLAQKAISYLEGLAKVDPKGMRSREIKWLQSIARMKAADHWKVKQPVQQPKSPDQPRLSSLVEQARRLLRSKKRKR